MNTEEMQEKQSTEELLKATVRNVGELASIASQQLEETVTKGKAKLTEMQTVVAEKTRECARNTDEYVHQNPWKAVGIAAGAGFLIGLLLRR